MYLKDSSGREFEASFYGTSDDIQCGYASYTDDGSDVSDYELEWAMDAYTEEIDMYRMERSIMAAESYYEGER
jgi:hypothetical protein